MALSTLRLLCSDLKADKKWRQYAGAQVMIFLYASCTICKTLQLERQQS